MKTKFFSNLPIVKSILVASSLITSVATAAVTAPVGYVKLTFNKEADTPFSIPMNRAKVFAGKISANSANTITIASDDFTASQFVYNDGTQNEKYYILFTSGTLEGRSFDIESNTVNTVTVTQSSVDPTGIDELDDLINNASSTDSFEIRPHWTLNTLFPDGEGFPAIDSRFKDGSSILFKPNDANSTNHAPNKGYKYVTGIGWVSVFNGFEPPKNDTILDRNVFFIFRNLEDTDITKAITGDVPTVKARIPLFANLIDQDSHISFSYPTSLTLASSGLSTSANFKSATSKFAQDGDILFVYDYAQTGYNNAPVKGYFYVNNEGWYDAFKVFGGVIPASTDLNSVGTGFLIRKKGETEAIKLKEQIELPYNPFAE